MSDIENIFLNKNLDQIKDIINYNKTIRECVPDYVLKNWIQKIEIFTNDYLYINKYFPNIKLLNKELSYEIHEQISVLLGIIRRFEKEIIENIKKDCEIYISNNKISNDISNNKKTLE